MPSTYTGNLGIELPADGELDGVWGDVVNDNMNILDRAINGSLALALSGTSSTLTTSDGSLSDGQYKLLVLGGTPSGTHTITIAPSDAQKIYFVRNTTAQSVVFTQGSGGNVTVATGDSAIIYSDGAGAGAAVVNITNDFAMSSVKITGGTIDGTVIGGTSAAAGTFTTANATTVDTTNIEVTTLKAKDGTAAGSIADSTGVVTLASSVLTTTDINGGTIDGTTIGGTSAAAGTFTTATATTGNITTVNATTVDTTNLEVTTLKAKDGTAAGSIADATGVVTLASSVLTTTDINGGTIDGTTIGGSSAAAGTFTTATATTGNITTVNATTVDTTNIEVTTLKAKDGTSAGSIANSTGVVTLASSVLTTTDINGGTIDGAVIGGSSAAAGAFTTVAASGQASFADGSAAAPSIAHTGDLNAGLFFPAADTVAVSTAGTERLRVDSSGNVGIGTASPSYHLDVSGSGQQGVRVITTDTSGTNVGRFSAEYTGGGGGAASAIDMRAGDGYTTIITTTNTSMLFSTNNTERMRIDTSGNVGIGTSSPGVKADINGVMRSSTWSLSGTGVTGGTAAFSAGTVTTDTNWGMYFRAPTSSSAIAEYSFRNSADTERIRIDSSGVVTIANLAGTGSRAVNASATGVLSAASDSRLKQEVPEASIAGLAEIMQLRPVAYKWLDDIANRGDEAAVELGFFADEAKDIIPSAAPMGNDGYYGFYDRAVIAALTKAVQEQQAIITALTARIAALEA